MRQATLWIDLDDPTADAALEELRLCVWAFPRSLWAHVSAPEKEQRFQSELVEEMGEEAASRVLEAANRPLRALQLISVAMDRLPIDEKKKVEMDKSVILLSDAFEVCERLFTSPVPLVYTRHTARFLSLWLLLLPLGLWEGFANSWNHLALVPASIITAIFLFGIEELAVQLEEPFSILPLEALTKEVHRSAADLIGAMPLSREPLPLPLSWRPSVPPTSRSGGAQMSAIGAYEGAAVSHGSRRAESAIRPKEKRQGGTTRRAVVGLLTASSGALALSSPATAADLAWEPLRNVQLGSSALRRIETTFPPEFCAYLARVLINWDPVTRRWWAVQFKDADDLRFGESLPDALAAFGEERRQGYLEACFSSLITSVEVSLEKFEGENGARRLSESLAARFTEPEQKVALAQLFSMVRGEAQPRSLVASLVGELDNAKLAELSVLEGGLYGSEPPAVQIAPPPTADGKAARARAKMRATGRVRRIAVSNGGAGYSQDAPPLVTISAPSDTGGQAARATAVIREGAVVAVDLVAPGSKYALSDPLDVTIAPPPEGPDSREAKAEAVCETTVASLLLIDAGRGYNSDEPPQVTFSEMAHDAQASTARAVARLTGRAASPPSRVSLPLPLPRTGEMRTLHPSLLPPSQVPVRTGSDGGSGSSAGIFSVPGLPEHADLGSRAEKPVESFLGLDAASTAKIFLAGGTAASTAHTLLVPIDVVKTRLQTEAGRYDGPADCIRQVWQQEGPSGFAQGVGATVSGYALAGALSFGLLEVFSRALRELAGPGNALTLGTLLLAVASVLATCVRATAVCPFEAVRILSVRSGEPSAVILQRTLDTEGIGALYRGLAPILLKEVPFAVTKFVAFDSFSNAIAAALPDASGALLFSEPIAAGALAGVLAILASQPADVVMTRTNDEGATLGGSIAEVAAKPALVLNGLGPRLLFGVLLTSVQFLLYTQLRSALGVSKADIVLVWDVLAELRVS